jgi:UDPglucose 6-dehydrogenase
VNKSTVPVGSATMVEQVIGRSDIAVVSNPEFLREGTAVLDSLHPDRIVVGADDPQAAAKVGELFWATGAPLIVTDATTSETIKYASNAFLATKLSFVNALAGLCEEVGADARDVLLGLGYDKRIGFEFLRPGPGWGGSCLPKDTRALLHIAREAGYDFSLLAGAIASNGEQLDRVIAKVETASGGTVDGVRVAVWGLTFKANTDDRRDSPALQITRRLVDLGATVQAFDPTVEAGAAGGDGEADVPDDLQGLRLCADPYEAASGARAVVVLTEWDEFRWLDFARVLGVMAEPSIVDARNLLDPAAVRRMGFRYTGIGRQ